MFQINKTLISEELISKYFKCNLSACQGACCVEGEAGAPLEEDEIKMLEDDFNAIRPFLSTKGLKTIEDQGKHVKRKSGELETPLVNNKECAYVVFNPNGTTQCGIENAYKSKKINWKKPISCHLYPVRVTNYSEFSAVNYHKWEICNPACNLGDELKVPVYEFVKKALIRKFGKKWYDKLESIAKKKNS